MSPSSTWMCSLNWKFPGPPNTGISWRLPHVGTISELCFQPLSHLCSMGVELEIPSFIRGLVSLVTSPYLGTSHPRADQSLLIRTKVASSAPITWEFTGDLGALCQGQRQILLEEMPLLVLSLKRLQGPEKLCTGNQRQRSIYIFYYLTGSQFSPLSNGNIGMCFLTR